MPLEVTAPEEALRWFVALSAPSRATFLAALAHGLTIASRCFFNALEPAHSDAVRARAVNELLHQVTGYLRAMLAGDENFSMAPRMINGLLVQTDSELMLQVHQAWQCAVEATDAQQVRQRGRPKPSRSCAAPFHGRRLRPTLCLMKEVV